MLTSAYLKSRAFFSNILTIKISVLIVNFLALNANTVQTKRNGSIPMSTKREDYSLFNSVSYLYAFTSVNLLESQIFSITFSRDICFCNVLSRMRKDCYLLLEALP